MQFDNQKTRNVADVVAKILAGESAKQEPQMLGEELVGNQHKIDANKNKKIDAHDFKMLRAQKDKEKANSQKFGKDVKEDVEELDEVMGMYTHYVVKHPKTDKIVHYEVEFNTSGNSEMENRSILRKRYPDHKVISMDHKNKKIDPKMVKEETELAESHFKVGDKVRCKESGMDGKIIKLDKEDGGEDEKYYTFKREDGKVMKKAPNELSKINEEVDKKKKDLPFTPDATKKPVRNSDGTIQKPMSLARELAKRGLKKAMSKEEVEQIDELSKDTLKSYAGKVIDKTRTMPQGEKKQKHLIGLERSMDKMKKEETEIDEAMFPGTKEYEKKYGESPQQKLKKKGDTVPTSQGEMKKTEKGVQHSRRFSEMISAYQEQGLKYISELSVEEQASQEEYEKEVNKAKNKSVGKEKADVAKAYVQAVKNEEYEIIDANEINGVRFATIEEGAKETETRARELADKLSKKDPKKSQFYRDMANQALTRIKKGVGIGSYRPGDIEGGGNKSLRRQGIEPAGKSPVFPFRKEEVDLEERSLTEPEMKKKEEMVKGMKKGMSGFKQRYGDRAKEVMYATATARAKGE
jgi:hypothetical protein